MNPDGLVTERIIAIARGGGRVFALVQCRDGRYGVTRDGEPVPGTFRPERQMEACVEDLVRLAGVLGPEDAGAATGDAGWT